MIQFPCACGRQLSARDEDAGRAVKCPVCGAIGTVPAQSQQPAPPEPVREDPPRARLSSEDDDRVRPSRRDREDDYDDRPRRRDRDDDDRPRRRRDREEPATSGAAVAALIFGILAFPCSFLAIAGIPAVICALIALRGIGRSEGAVGGKGLAIGGLVLGGLGILLTAPVGYFSYMAYVKIGETRDRIVETNNMRQIGLALHSYESAYGLLPPQTIRSADGKPLLSWRVAILPYIEQDFLYKQFKLDEPWDSPHNIKLLPLMPKVYLQPGQTNDGKTYYQVVTGKATGFPPQGQRRFTDFVNGTSNTIVVITAANAVPWTKPEDVPFEPGGALPAFNTKFKGGTHVLIGDGSVRLMPHNTPEAEWRRQFSINDDLNK